MFPPCTQLTMHQVPTTRAQTGSCRYWGQWVQVSGTGYLTQTMDRTDTFKNKAHLSKRGARNQSARVRFSRSFRNVFRPSPARTHTRVYIYTYKTVVNIIAVMPTAYTYGPSVFKNKHPHTLKHTLKHI